MQESEPGTTTWNFFNAETLFSNYYYGDSNQHDVKICHEQYVRASPFDTCYWNMNDDENFARSLSQEEWSQLSIAESPELTNFRPEYVESSYQNWRNDSNNYYTGQEGGLYETDDVGRLCSSPGERSCDENEHSYKFKVTDESELDVEVEKRLYQMYSVPHIPRINGEIPSVYEATSDHQRLLDRLELYDLIEHKTQGDGNCQFRALSDQFYRSPEHHKFVREQVVRQLKAHPEIYEAYVPMEYSDYLKTISKSGEWGDHVTLQAAADSYGVRILILTSFKDTCYIEILPKEQKSNRACSTRPSISNLFSASFCTKASQSDSDIELPDVNDPPAFSSSSPTQMRSNAEKPLENGMDVGIYKAILVGQVGQAPLQKKLKSGRTVTLLSLGTGGIRNNRRPLDNEDPRDYANRCAVQWHRVSIYPERLGELAMKNLVPGSIVYLEGNLESKVFSDPITGLVRRIREVAIRRNGRLLFLGNGSDSAKLDLGGVGYY